MRESVAWYTRLVLEVPSVIEQSKERGLTRGLQPSLFRTSLSKKLVGSYDELLKRAAKYINAEEMGEDFIVSGKIHREKTEKLDGRSERKERVRESSDSRDRAPARRTESYRGARRNPLPLYDSYTPLNQPRSQVWEVAERDVAHLVHYPKKLEVRPGQLRSGAFCRFHNDSGHHMDDCRHLKDEIERLIQAGHLKEFVYRDREVKKFKREDKKKEERENSPKRR